MWESLIFGHVPPEELMAAAKRMMDAFDVAGLSPATRWQRLMGPAGGGGDVPHWAPLQGKPAVRLCPLNIDHHDHGPSLTTHTPAPLSSHHQAAWNPTSKRFI